MPADTLNQPYQPLPERTALLGMDLGQLTDYLQSLGEKPFRARQMLKWIYQRDVLDLHAMTDLSKGLRQRLDLIASLELPTVRGEHRARDGVVKWLVDVGAGQAVETVFIPEPDRGTLCISSQAGCALDCGFCATAQQGFNRNLSSAEIVGQVLIANRALGARAAGNWPVTNVVFMGMGEPLANYRGVIPAARLLLDDCGFGLSRRRVTISTVGLVQQIRKLKDDVAVALAVSLHAPVDDLRDQLVPINRRYPIAELLDACWQYVDGQGSRHVTFEYVMLDKVNDSLHLARRLSGLLKGRPAKVNLIPFNPFPHTIYRRSAGERIEAFRNELWRRGVVTTIRRTRGDDIDAACGQLAGRIADRTKIRLGTKLNRAR